MADQRITADVLQSARAAERERVTSLSFKKRESINHSYPCAHKASTTYTRMPSFPVSINHSYPCPPQSIKHTSVCICMWVQGFTDFHDASPVTCTFKLNVYHCLKAIHLAHKTKLFDYKDFDIRE